MPTIDVSDQDVQRIVNAIVSHGSALEAEDDYDEAAETYGDLVETIRAQVPDEVAALTAQPGVQTPESAEGDRGS